MDADLYLNGSGAGAGAVGDVEEEDDVVVVVVAVVFVVRADDADVRCGGALLSVAGGDRGRAKNGAVSRSSWCCCC